MHILIVNSYYYPEIEGGAEYSVKMLAETLVKNGHMVSVICTSEENIHENIKGVDIYRFKSKCLVRTKDCYKKNTVIRKAHRLLDVYNPFNYKVLDRLVKMINPDVIHSNGLYDISPIIWRVAKANKISLVHTLRDYCLICEHSNLLRRQTGEACVRPRWLCKGYRWFNALQTKNVDVVTAPSKHTLDIVCKAGLFDKAGKAVVFNATDIDIEQVQTNIDRRNVERRNRNVFTFVFIGTFVEFKGVKWLIESFERTKDMSLRLLLCGKGELLDYIKEAEKKDSRIKYRGFLEQKELREVLETTDVLVCPSLWNEPFGRVVLDAYQAGMPVIATNIGALPSIVKDGKTGVIVNAADDNSLYNALYKIRTNISIYGSNIKEFVENFTLEAQQKRFVEIYKSAAKTK